MSCTGKALLALCAVAFAPRAFGQCVNYGYIVVDGLTCDWTAAENYLTIPGLLEFLKLFGVYRLIQYSVYGHTGHSK